MSRCVCEWEYKRPILRMNHPQLAPQAKRITTHNLVLSYLIIRCIPIILLPLVGWAKARPKLLNDVNSGHNQRFSFFYRGEPLSSFFVCGASRCVWRTERSSIFLWSIWSTHSILCVSPQTACVIAFELKKKQLLSARQQTRVQISAMTGVWLDSARHRCETHVCTLFFHVLHICQPNFTNSFASPTSHTSTVLLSRKEYATTGDRSIDLIFLSFFLPICCCMNDGSFCFTHFHRN